MQLDRQLPYWGPTITTQAYNQMANFSLCINANFRPTKRETHTSTCVEPLPVELIKLAVQACCTSNTAKHKCIADMITIGFFFLFGGGGGGHSDI